MPITIGRKRKKRVLKELVIPRARWLTPDNFPGVGSTLYNPKVKAYCCLGFWARDILGTKPQAMKWDASPGYYNDSHERSWHSAAININDSPFISAEQREAALIKIFHRAGIKLSFTGHYRKVPK